MPKSHPNTPKRIRKLNERQKAFASAYVTLRSQGKESGTEAARMAGYKGRPDSLAKAARANLDNPQVKALIDDLTNQALVIPRPAALTKFRFILGINETLAMVSFLGTATLDGVLDDKGNLDLKKARETGTIHVLTRLKTKTVERQHKDGTVDHMVTQEIAIEPRSKFLELMGRNLGLWEGEMKDPMAVIKRIMEQGEK